VHVHTQRPTYSNCCNYDFWPWEYFSVSSFFVVIKQIFLLLTFIEVELYISYLIYERSRWETQNIVNYRKHLVSFTKLLIIFRTVQFLKNTLKPYKFQILDIKTLQNWRQYKVQNLTNSTLVHKFCYFFDEAIITWPTTIELKALTWIIFVDY